MREKIFALISVLLSRAFNVDLKNHSLHLASKDSMATVCCESPIELMHVGEEYFARCMECGKYIGHIVDRQLALLYSNFRSHVLEAATNRRLVTEFTEQELDTIYNLYVANLQGWAGQAARHALRHYVPIEM